MPDLGTAGKTLALFSLAGLELLACDPRRAARDQLPVLDGIQGRLRSQIAAWCAALVGAAARYLRDYPGEGCVPLWGYHQLHAVAWGAQALGQLHWLAACVETVTHLVAPAVLAKGWYAFDPLVGGTKQGLCAYCLSPLAQGLAELYRATHTSRYRTLALSAVDWLYGANDAHTLLYDISAGRCSDGLDGPNADHPSPNCGAESAIEAGFMELVRQDLLAFCQ
jgi:hypothetical protein